MKSEVNRILNRLVKVKQPTEIVVERLNFHNPNLGKKMNRMISNFGKGAVAAKLLDLTDKYGIKVTYINPAYTSQECSSCHYVDKKNRKSQAKFLCLNCGCKKHADANASRNLVWRRSLNDLSSVYVSKSVILDRLVKRFISRQKYGCKATAPDYIKKNPYFKGHL